MIIFGKQVIDYAISKHPKSIKEVYLSKKLDKANFAKVSKLGVVIKNIDNKKAQALAQGRNHQGIFAKIDDLELSDISTIKNYRNILLLHSITDVGNIGSIIRSAYIFGIDAIVITGIKNIEISGVIRSSAGAALDLPITIYSNVMTLINELKQIGFNIIATSKDGGSIKNFKFKEKNAIIFGSEGEGLSDKIIKKCDETITIKMTREFDSLNVSAAASIICHRMDEWTNH
jgi:23S rRNA (guanosine2251-2'-O)-methyltransferase